MKKIFIIVLIFLFLPNHSMEAKLDSMSEELETLKYVITAIHYGNPTTAKLALQKLENSTNPYSCEIALFIRSNYQKIKAQKPTPHVAFDKKI